MASVIGFYGTTGTVRHWNLSSIPHLGSEKQFPFNSDFCSFEYSLITTYCACWSSFSHLFNPSLATISSLISSYSTGFFKWLHTVPIQQLSHVTFSLPYNTKVQLLFLWIIISLDTDFRHLIKLTHLTCMQQWFTQALKSIIHALRNPYHSCFNYKHCRSCYVKWVCLQYQKYEQESLQWWKLQQAMHVTWSVSVRRVWVAFLVGLSQEQCRWCTLDTPQSQTPIAGRARIPHWFRICLDWWSS